jgi:hypothetical protein
MTDKQWLTILTFCARRMADNKLMLNSHESSRPMEERILITLLPKLLVEMNSTLE